MTIFVSIASYRDPELVPTIEDALAKARHPEDLRFGICFQHGPDETLPFASDPRFRVLDVDWRESRGACWARAEIMGLYRDEDFFLQLDSHHRFVPDWDERLLAQLERTGSPKAILTAYATPFTPGDPSSFGREPMKMDFARFTPEGIVLFRPSPIAGHERREAPVRARFLSAHFLFARGELVREVPYDPDLYFIGEEITLAVRAFTHGWDFFHPTEIIVWHEYTREYRPHKHWSDHVADNGVPVAWHERDAASKERVRRFLERPTVGPLGLGTVRSFADYEAYAGLDFRRRCAQDYTRRHLEPPNPPAAPGWGSGVARYDLRIALDRAILPEGASEAAFWFVGFHDGGDEELDRQDALPAEIAAALAVEGPTVSIARSFESEREPTSWTVWPCAADGEWLDKIRGDVVVARPAPATFVTALVDLGRDALDPAFARSFEEHYLPRFERLLAMDAPMVVYVDPSLEPFVRARRSPSRTRVIHLTRRDLEALPSFERVQAIRARPDWASQAAWLGESPQAKLAGYAPLVLSKMLWLQRAARENPFGTDALYWIDAGLEHTVPAARLTDPALPARLSEAARELVFLAYPHVPGREVHGFASDALARHAGVEAITHVVRGGLFGGRSDAVLGVAALYEALLAETLEEGLLGTEESVLTILAFRHPELLRPFVIGEDGLVAPFFEALLEGREAAMRTFPPRRRPPPGLFGADPEGARTGESRFLGLRMQQNRNAPHAFDALFRHLEAEGVRVARVIELGTGAGGLSVLLQLQCLTLGADFVTYDVTERTQSNPAFGRLGIEQRLVDVRDELVAAEIARAVEAEGVTVLVCDGGDKEGDAARFSDHLKKGDLLLVHDYAPSREVFEREVEGRLWSWCEATDEGLAAPSRKNDLREILPDVMHAAVWTCRVKHGETRRRAPRLNIEGAGLALYALSYNLPQQLALFLESVERVDPGMLRRADKFLLDNSTDPSTRPAYDALCERYGFTALRHGNLGITGGRIACAHHFEALERHDAMLYFEDDMLLAEEEGLCRNGFPRRVRDLTEKALAIVKHESGLDFLKLSFSEVCGDHRIHWAYMNLDEVGRARHFPDGPTTRVDTVKSHDGLAYALAEVHYSNWPMLITRRGSRTLFPRGVELPRYEGGLMIRGLELAREGELRSGVLLASPIHHHRAHHYGEERKES